MKRYKYTILLVTTVLLLSALLTMAIRKAEQNKRECEASGGDYYSYPIGKGVITGCER